MASAIVPGIYDAALADEDLRVATEDAQEMTRRLARDGTACSPASRAAPRWRPRCASRPRARDAA